MEKPYSGNAIINDTLSGFEINIPTKKNWFILIFLGVWLCGWTMGELSAIAAITGLFSENIGFANLFIVFWLIGWTIGGFFAFKTFLWNLKGKEIISFRNSEFTIQKVGALFSKPKTYNLKEAKKFRVQEESNVYGSNNWGNRNNFGSLYASNGTIRFDYGLKTVKIASGIDEAEANHILEKLKSKGILNESNF